MRYFFCACTSYQSLSLCCLNTLKTSTTGRFCFAWQKWQNMIVMVSCSKISMLECSAWVELQLAAKSPETPSSSQSGCLKRFPFHHLTRVRQEVPAAPAAQAEVVPAGFCSCWCHFLPRTSANSSFVPCLILCAAAWLTWHINRC